MRPRRERRHRAGSRLAHVCVATAAGSLTLLACSGTGDPPAMTSQGTPFSAVFGFDPIAGTWRRNELNDQVSRCLAAAGFDVQLAEPEPAGPAVDSTFKSIEWLVYGPPADTHDQDPLIEYSASLSTRERAVFESVLYGTEDAPGCLPAAQIDLYGGSGVISPALAAVIDDINALVLLDPDMHDALQDWSACMTTRGFEFDSPDQIIAELGRLADQLVQQVNESGAQLDPNDDEVARAVRFEDEVEDAFNICDEQTDRRSTYFEALHRVEQAYLEANPGVVELVGEQT